MKREEYGENKEVGNIKEKVFVIFVLFLKQSKKCKKTPWLLTTNGSTNHTNLLSIVASRVSLAITSP